MLDATKAFAVLKAFNMEKRKRNQVILILFDHSQCTRRATNQLFTQLSLIRVLAFLYSFSFLRYIKND